MGDIPQDRSHGPSPLPPPALPPGPSQGLQCLKCKKTLRTSQGLKSHITRLHPIDYPTVPPHSGDGSQGPAVGVDSSLRIPQPCLSAKDLAIHLGHLRSSSRIVRRIPKGARFIVADALTTSIEACTREPTPQTWTRLLSFAPICLSLPNPTSPTKTSLTSLIIHQAGTFKDGGPLPALSSSSPKRQTRALTDDMLASKAQAKLADGDLRGAIRMLGTDSSFATPDEDTLVKLRSKHPPPISSECLPLVSPSAAPLQVSESSVVAAIGSFPAGSAGGLDLLRPQHLKDLIGKAAGAAGVRLITAIAGLCNFMLNGSVPEFIRPLLYGASLCALLKPSGDLRPIAIGCTFRRLVAKLGSSHISDRLGRSLRPTQLGFGSKGGLEAATHALRRYASHHHQSPKVLLKVDFSNAYNSVHRDKLLHSVHHQLPELYPFISQNYSLPSYLLFGHTILDSERGIQQGDPLGPALFCLISHPMTKNLHSELNIWYQDDGALADSPDTVLRDFKTLTDSSRTLGLELNSAKCELVIFGASTARRFEIFHSFQGLSPDIQLVQLRDCTQLGTPLFKEAAAQDLTSKSSQLSIITGRLQHLPAHSALYIIKNSQAIPKLTHLLRCSPAWECDEQLHRFDLTLRDGLQSVLNINISDTAWAQAAWPIALGGMGIRHATELAPIAFLASIHSTEDLLKTILPTYISAEVDVATNSCLTKWTSTSGIPPPSAAKRFVQAEWEAPIFEKSRTLALEQAPNPLFKARLLSVASAESGAFLVARPAASLGTLMEDGEIRVAVALRLGLDLCSSHSCQSCGATVTPKGNHGLCCRRSAGRTSRHASVNDIVKRALSSAGIPSTLEPTHLSTDTNIRPDGMSLIPWERGQSVVWDFTCSDSTAPSYLASSSVEPLFAARSSERLKLSKYSEIANTHIFIPIAAECLGAIGQIGLSFLRAVGRRIQAVSGERRATEYLFQRISVAIQRGNAKAVAGTTSNGSSLDDDLDHL